MYTVTEFTKKHDKDEDLQMIDIKGVCDLNELEISHEVFVRAGNAF